MRKYICLFVLCIASITIAAQETREMMVVQLKSGISITGYVTNNTDGSISVTTADGDQLQYRSSEVISVNTPKQFEKRQKTETKRNKAKKSGTVGTDGWTEIWVEYNPIKLEYETNYDSYTGFSGGISRTFSISQGSPLLIETGVGIQYANYHENSYKEDLLSVKVPVNFLFGFELPNGNVSFYPYAGVTMRINAIGNFDNGAFKGSLFDKDVMYYPWGRFQIYWQVGLKACLGKILVGFSYGKDMMEIADGLKMQTTSISVGFSF